MAITTLAGLAAGLQPEVFMQKTAQAASGLANVPYGWWTVTGYPPAQSNNSSGVSGVALTNASVTGGFPLQDPPSGNMYLAGLRSQQNSSNPRIMWIADRLWHNSGLSPTVTTAQTVNSVAWPARDANGSTNGEGVYIAVEIATSVGAGTPTLTMSYTNSAGTAGRTATSIIATVASSPGQCYYVLGLQAGDTGVRSVQTFTLSATWASGAINLVALRPIVLMGYGWDRNNFEDAVTLGMPRLYNGTCLQAFMMWSGATSSAFQMSASFAVG